MSDDVDFLRELVKKQATEIEELRKQLLHAKFFEPLIIEEPPMETL